MKPRFFSNPGFLFFIIILLASAPYCSAAPDSTAGPQKTGVVNAVSSLLSGKAGSAYRLNVNKINLPLSSDGVLAGVNVSSPGVSGYGAWFGNGVFLFSSGFFLSGYSGGQLWSSGVATASGFSDYMRGTIADGRSDARAQLYVVKAQDEPFGASWIDWKDAVALGADFYDGDGDKYYNPVDKNRNGKWDPNEDSPDILGDEHVWCVYNDGLNALRPGRDSDPVGLEVRQSVFAFASEGPLGNILFVRYRIKYAGADKPDEPVKLDSVFFGVWSDPDIGQPFDDLVGCDTVRNAGFIFNRSSDPGGYGSVPPCFLVDFFSGPAAYIKNETYTDVNNNNRYDEGIDVALDTATRYLGQLRGIAKMPGAKNLGVSSFVNFMYADPDYRDPSTKFDIRNAMLGKNRKGVYPNPCTLSYGFVGGGVNCSTVNKQYWYSGDPVRGRGWVNRTGSDHRMMLNTGPFDIAKNEEKEIIVAYVVDQGTSPISAVTKTKETDDVAQFIFDRNFAAPAAPKQPRESDGNLRVARGTSFIDLVWDTPPQVGFTDSTVAFDLRFQGYTVYAYASRSPAEFVGGTKNRVEIARYDMKNFIGNVYRKNLKTGGFELLYPAAVEQNKLDGEIYTNPKTGKLRVRLTKDPFTGGDLIKGKPYYFAITSYSLNRKCLVFKSDPAQPVGTPGDYYLSQNTMVMNVENSPEIITVVAGEDMYIPPSDTVSVAGAAGGIVYDVIDREALTGDSYSLSFFPDSSAFPYSSYWRLENTTKKTILTDSSKNYSYGGAAVAENPTDGFILRVKNVAPECGSIIIENRSGILKAEHASFHYLTKDASNSVPLIPIGGTLHTLRSNFVRADRLRRVEIRFGEHSTAYRYLNGMKGNSPFQRNASFVFAAVVTSSDTAGTGGIPASGWDAAENRAAGLVDVPFAAYVKDFVTNETRRLAVGIIEKAYAAGGKPDGVWDPDSIAATGEYILVFDADYDAAGGHAVLKGGPSLGTAAPYADLRGGLYYDVRNVSGLSARERMIAASPFLNTLYAVALPKRPGSLSAEDKAVITVKTYPYNPAASYTFSSRAKGELSREEKSEIFRKVNVFPNPLYGFNAATSYTNIDPDKPFVTFTNLPSPVTIKIYTLSGTLLRELNDNDKSNPSSPFLKWDLKNRDDLRAASGVFLAVVSSPEYGTKVLKFSIILPSLQLIR